MAQSFLPAPGSASPSRAEDDFSDFELIGPERAETDFSDFEFVAPDQPGGRTFAGDVGRLFLRGAGEGLLRQAQGGAGGLARMGEDGVDVARREAVDAIATGLEGRAEQGGVSGVLSAAGAKFLRSVRAAETGLKDILRGVEGKAGELRQAVRENLPVNDESALSFVGQVAEGLGQMAGTLPVWAIPYVGPVAGVAGTVGEMYQGGYEDATATLRARRESGEIEASDEEIDRTAHDAGIANIPGAALETVADRLLIGKVLRPLKGKVTVGEMIKRIAPSTAVKGVAEGSTEAAQQAWTNAVASQLIRYDPDRELDDEVIRSFTVGATVGLIASGAIDTARTMADVRAARTRAVEQLDATAGTARTIASEAARIGRAEERAAEEGELVTPDDVAAAQAAIIDKTRVASQSLERTTEVGRAAQAELAAAQSAENEILSSIERSSDRRSTDRSLGLMLQLDRATEEDVLQTVAEDALAPWEAVERKYPEQARQIADDPRLAGQLLVEVERADGSVVPAAFAGYWDLGGGNRPAAVGYFLDNGGVSHGVLRPTERLRTPVPTPDQWEAGVRSFEQASGILERSEPVSEAIEPEPAPALSNPALTTEIINALPVEETGAIPRDQPSGNLQSVEAEVRGGPAGRIAEPVVGTAQEVVLQPAASPERLTAALVDTATQDEALANPSLTGEARGELTRRISQRDAFLARLEASRDDAGLIEAPPETRVTVQQPLAEDIPGYVLVDLVDPTLPGGAANILSSNPERIARAGIVLPVIPADLPSGAYTVAQLQEMAAQRLARNEDIEAAPASEVATAVRGPDAFDRGAPAREQAVRGSTRAKARRLARIGLPADGNPDLLNAIQDIGGVPAPRKGQVGGEYDGFREAFSGIARWLVNSSGPGSRTGSGGIDIVVQQLESYGYRFDSIDDFYSAVARAVAQRKRVAESVARANKLDRLEASFLNNEKPTRKRTPERPVSIDELAVGDSFRVDEERFVVTGIDEEGNVTIRDGLIYEVAAGTLVYPDKGSLRRVTREVEFVPDDELASVEPVPQRVSDLPQEIPPGPALELVSGTEAEFQAEAEALAEATRRRLERERIAELSERPLIGDNSDVGQATLFTADEDLFSGPSEQTRSRDREMASVVRRSEPEPFLEMRVGAAPQSTIDEVQAATGRPAPVSVPWAQQLPATPIPGYRGETRSSTSDLEAAEVEGLAALADIPDPDLVPEPVKTLLFGTEMTVAGRRRLDDRERARARARAARLFANSGIAVTWDETNEVYRLTDPATPIADAGASFAEALEGELARGVGPGDPLLSVVVNSVRNADGGMWTSPAFSPAVRNRLFAMAQGEASFYGLMLGALSKAKRTLSFVAEHVDVILHKAYSEAFGGPVTQRILDRTRRRIGREITDRLEPLLPGDALDALDTDEARRTDLDLFVSQLLAMAERGVRVEPMPSTPTTDRIAALFPLAGWRSTITRRGAGDLTRTILDRLQRADPAEPGTDSAAVEEAEGSVKRLDRLLQRELRGIVNDVLGRQTGVADRDLVAELATSRGDIQTSAERLALVDEQVSAQIERLEAEALEAGQGAPDEIAERFRALRSRWEETAGALSNRVASASLLRRIVHEELATIFEENGLSWSIILREPSRLARIRSAVGNAVENRLLAINRQAPEAALGGDDIARIVSQIGTTFDAIEADKRQRRQAAAGSRLRDGSSPRTRSGRPSPQRTADAELNRLSRVHSDVQAWPTPRRNAVREAIARQRREPKPESEFVAELVALGVQEPTAASLTRILDHDIRARGQIAMWNEMRRVASARSPSRATPIRTLERREGIRPLVESILTASPAQQVEAGWRLRTATDYFTRNGMSPGQAALTAAVFDREFRGLFEQTRQRAFELERRGLTRQESRLLGNRSQTRRLWERIQRAVNAGIFDSGVVVEEMAAAFGWLVPTAAQRQRLRDLSIREQELRTLTPAEREAIGPDPEATRLAEMEKTAVTKPVRMGLRREMQTTWARFSRPITWRTDEGRRNFGAAGGEFISANLLLKLGFGIKQIGDVGAQTLWHVPTRAVGSAVARHLERPPESRSIGLLVEDASRSLGEGMRAISESAAIALDQFRQGAAGRGELRNVAGLISSVSAFDRLRQRADEYEARGDHGRALVTRLLALPDFSFRYARGLDNVQGAILEAQEMRQRIISELEENGRTNDEARTEAEAIVGDHAAEMQLAMGRAKQILDELGLPYAPVELRSAAYELFKARQYARMRAASLPAEAIADDIEIIRQTNGWNMQEAGGLGGAIGVGVRALGRFTERAGVPLAIGRFSNAIAIGINRALTWSGGGFFPRLFGGEDNFWFRTPRDRIQRKLEAATGLSIGSIFIALGLAGVVRVWRQPPEDPEDRDLWEKEGHRAGTIEINLPGGGFMAFSLSSGPFSYLRGPLGALGAVQDALDRRARQRRRFAERGELRGETVAELPSLTMSELGAAASYGAYDAVMGGRTTGGLVSSFVNPETRLPSLTRAVASQVSAGIPFLPAYQELQRAYGTRMDPRFSDFFSLLVPTPDAPGARRNFLGDPITPSRAQSIIQTMTGGTGLPVDPSRPKEDTAYRILGRIDYRPGSLSRSEGYLIDGMIRPLTDDEFVAVSRLRGTLFKRELMAIDENETDEAIDLLARDAAKRAKEDALAAAAGASAIDLRQVRQVAEAVDAIPRQAAALFERVRRLPPEQWGATIAAAVADGTVPPGPDGRPDEAFVAEFNRLVSRIGNEDGATDAR